MSHGGRAGSPDPAPATRSFHKKILSIAKMTSYARLLKDTSRYTYLNPMEGDETVMIDQAILAVVHTIRTVIAREITYITTFCA